MPQDDDLQEMVFTARVLAASCIREQDRELTVRIVDEIAAVVSQKQIASCVLALAHHVAELIHRAPNPELEALVFQVIVNANREAFAIHDRKVQMN